MGTWGSIRVRQDVPEQIELGQENPQFIDAVIVEVINQQTLRAGGKIGLHRSVMANPLRSPCLDRLTSRLSESSPETIDKVFVAQSAGDPRVDIPGI